MAELDTLMQERLADQLLAFGQAPGRFAVHLGEPALVHNQMDTVVAWALGRTPEGWAERAEALKDSAVLFVLRSCFAAHNNLYQVLGLRGRVFEAGELKQRYRALIRLAHPDMNVKGLPANASALVNRAYEVLSDPEARDRYDAELADNGTPNAMAAAPAGYRPAPRYRAELHTEPSWTERAHAFTAQHPGLVRKGMVGLGVVFATVLLIWTAASDNTESRMLVAGNMPTTTSNRKAVVPEISQATPAQGSGAAATKPAGNKPPAQSASVPAAAPNAQAVSAGKAPLTLPPFESLPSPASKPGAIQTAAAPTKPVDATAAREPVANAGNLPTPAAAAAPSAVTPPAATTAQAPANAWPIDGVAAKQFLTTVLNALENPTYTRQVNATLETSKVKGSLLAPALTRLKSPASIEKMGWTETNRPGALQVQGYVELTPDGPERADTPRVRFTLQAEFIGTRDGTAMSALTLKDDTQVPTPAPPPVAVAPKPAAQPPQSVATPAPVAGVVPTVAATGAAHSSAATQTAPSAPAAQAAARTAVQTPVQASPQPTVASAPPSPAPVEAAPPQPVWPVDVAKSKAYLTSALNALEQPQHTRQVVNYLAGLNVKGSLLRPAQQKLGDSRASVERISLTESHKPGQMTLHGHVVVSPAGADPSAGQLRFAVTAEFVGNKDGTALSALSLREEP